MGEVVSLPGVFRPELEQPVAPHQVLLTALAMAPNIQDIVYVARTTDGALLMGASHTDVDAAIGLLNRGVQSLICDHSVLCGDDPEREP